MAIEQIGQKLKAAREGQGLSLAQIFERTKIPINHLQALDAGVTDDLPEPVYVAGFIKRYADCVGLNGQNLSDEYRRQSSESGNGNGNGNGHGGGWAGRSNVAQPVMVSPAYIAKSKIEERQPNLFKMILFPACWIVLVLLVLTALFTYQNQNQTQVDTSLQSLQDSTRKFNAVPVGQNGATGPTQAGPTTAATATTTAPEVNPADSEAQVSLTASKHVWVDIKRVSTGESLFTGFLEAGDRRDYKDPQGVRVHAGNGASVTVVSDGKSQTLGVAGKPTEKVFAAKNPVATPVTGTTLDGAAGTNGAAGSTLTTAGVAAAKPVVKRVVKKPVTSDIPVAPRRRYHSSDDSGSRYGSGDASGTSRSIDVPYRYTEGHDSE